MTNPNDPNDDRKPADEPLTSGIGDSDEPLTSGLGDDDQPPRDPAETAPIPPIVDPPRPASPPTAPLPPIAAGSGPGAYPPAGGYPPPGGYPPAQPIAPIGQPQPPAAPGMAAAAKRVGAAQVPARRQSRWKQVRRFAIIAAVILLVVPAAAFAVSYLLVSVPAPGDIPTNQVVTIYANDGTTVISKVVPPEGNRTDVTIDQIPPKVRDAVIAAEDRDFYTNAGFSFTGFGRAARDNLLGKENAGGGSTITQQYVKNALVGSNRTIFRKLHELVVSTKMAKSWTKDEILAAYLNTIYFGRGAYGIAAAATAYFGKPVEQLSVAEGAVLASSIQRPSSLDPELFPDAAKERWNYVLDGMVSIQSITAEERAATDYPIVVPLASLPNPNQDAGPEGLIKSRVVAELEESGISEQQLNTRGLQVTTTIDPKAQAAALEAVKTEMANEPEELRTAVVSVDPRTGAVRAYYGGDNGQGYDFANAGLQTGSSFKVFGLAANLEEGVPLSKMYDSSALKINGITINNSEGESCGTCTIAEALKRSLNTSFYRMMLGLKDPNTGKTGNGPKVVADMAHKVGIAEEIPGVGKTLTEPDGSGPNNGIILGQYQTRVIDMASAYATFAASGVYHQPYFVQRVVTADGDVLLDRGQPAGERRIDAKVADNLTAAMKPIAAYSNGHNLAGGRPSAAKTGTAQLGDTGANKDAWMVGFTPSLSTAVWVGTEQGTAIKTRYGGAIYGSGIPSDIWKSTMDGALDDTPVEQFPTPAPIAGVAGVPAYSAPKTTTVQVTPTPQLPQSIEILPGIRIPLPGGGPQPAQPTRPQQNPGEETPSDPGAPEPAPGPPGG